VWLPVWLFESAAEWGSYLFSFKRDDLTRLEGEGASGDSLALDDNVL
jgi:hypothetical protein